MATDSLSGCESGLWSVLVRLSSCRSLRLAPAPPIRVAVLEIGRYLSDGRHSADGYSYDVTITDGHCRVKCYLASELNRAIQTNAVRCGSCVAVAQFSIIHDERRLHHCFVCIEQIRPNSHNAHDPPILPLISDLKSVVWWPGDGVVTAHAPLHHDRKHYLSLWNNEDPHGSVWVPHTTPPDVVVDVSKISLLADLNSFLVSSQHPLPLLVRVLHRSRLRYYGKPGQNMDFPFQAYFEVADQSGVMSMVLWNEMCPEWYNRLKVGSVLYLQHYTLKRSYQKRSRPQLSALSLCSLHSTEICLNPRNPTAMVTVVPPKDVQQRWGLPEVKYSFNTRFEIEGLASNQACDIIGLVTYVGRVERIRNKGNTMPEKFWTYRWVHAVDGTSDSPFILEIFSSSQPEIFNNISPMTYLVCTQMRVCREEDPALYLTSSAETQLFITGCHRKQPYVSDPKVKAFIQWTKTLKDSTVLKKTSVGGHYCYPPLLPTFTLSSSSNSGANELTPSLMAVGDLKRELESLQYRECRRVAIQGYITVVQYHHWPPESPSALLQLQPQVDHEPMGITPDPGPSVSTWTDSAALPKRRRLQQTDTSDGSAECEQGDRQYEVEGKRAFSQTSVNNEHEADSQQSVLCPTASWESSMWSLLKQDVCDHMRCSAVDSESIPESFHLNACDVLLHRINLSPSTWTPDLPSNIIPVTPSAVEFTGYLTLTVLGLNQQVAIDSVFLPVFSSEDPRASGTSCSLHDNRLLSCLTTGRVHAQPNFSPEVWLSSAPELENQKLVCVLDVCLLGENRLEIICSKIYRVTDITPV